MLYPWSLFENKRISSVLMIKLPVPHNYNGIKQFLSHKVLGEKLVETHTRGFQVRWEEG